MHNRLHRLDRLVPVLSASRVFEHEGDATPDHGGGWMSDIPRRPLDIQSARLTPERVTLIRRRIESGAYASAGYADDIARRMLASGDL